MNELEESLWKRVDQLRGEADELAAEITALARRQYSLRMEVASTLRDIELVQVMGSDAFHEA